MAMTKYLTTSCVFLLLSCNSGIFKKSDSNHSAENAQSDAAIGPENVTDLANIDTDPMSAEPVAVSGAYLVCAYTANGKSQLACRLEDQNQEKVSWTEARSDDLETRSPEADLLKLKFAVAPQASFWHWISVDNPSLMLIGSISISRRFVLDSEAAYTTSVLSSHTAFPLPQIADGPVDVLPAASLSIQFVDRNIVRANGNLWYHADAKKSCPEYCSEGDRGVYKEDITNEGVKDRSLCSSIFQTLQGPGRPPIDLVSDPQSSGYGCYSTGNVNAMSFWIESTPLVNKDAFGEGIRRLCSCGPAL